VILSKGASPRQGGATLLWEEGHQNFEVKAVNIVSPNLLMFQVVTGEDHFFVIGEYIPPDDTTGVDDLSSVWAARLINCKLLLLGDLKINLGPCKPCGRTSLPNSMTTSTLPTWHANLSNDKVNDRERGYVGLGSSGGGGWWYQSHPDYFMARERDTKLLHNVAFQ
jgi:hypothetical protein